MASHSSEPLMGWEAIAPSFIKKIEKVQGGEQAPGNGSLALPKDVAAKPFSLKGLFNAKLNVLVSILTRGSNGLPGAHANLSRSFPRLEQDPLEGILAVEVPTASFGPEIVEKKTLENVEGLSAVGETARVVAMEVRGVVFFFEHSFPEEDEGPSNGEAVGRLPFAPDSEKGIPSFLGRYALHEAVLGGLRESLVVTFVGGLNSHGLEPGAHRKPVVEGRPSERFDLVGTGIMPHLGNDLGDCGVAQVQALDEGDDVGRVLCSPGILVASLGRITKEGSVAHAARRLPMPIPEIPQEVKDKARFKDPVDWRFLT
jgi:hypothetical protein